MALLVWGPAALKLWLSVLRRNADPMLCGIEMPPQYTAGLNLNSPELTLPLRAEQIESLRHPDLEGKWMTSVGRI